MRLIDACEPVFARHETFHPRYSWFRKAYGYAAQNPRVFVRDDAPLVLGVGKNMVKAIRFWGLAAKLIKVEGTSKKRSSALVPTNLGHDLFGETGWDRYMEDPGTIWLLHWLLLSPPSMLPVWWIAFNEFSAVEFQDDELARTIKTRLEVVADWRMPHQSSIKKDINAMLRTYSAAQSSGRTGIDDVLDCPLRELDLINSTLGTNRFRFGLGMKPDLPPEVLAYAALDFVSVSQCGANTVSLGVLAGEPGAPGKVFKLTEREMLETLEPFVSKIDTLTLTPSTGAVQLSWSGDLAPIAKGILGSYYQDAFSVSKSGRTVGNQTRPSVVS